MREPVILRRVIALSLLSLLSFSSQSVKAGDPGINVKDFGAVGDGFADDTAAFNAALAAANKQKPLYVPAGNYIVSNLTFQGNSSSSGVSGSEQGQVWGLIGDGAGVVTITGKAGSTGVMIQAGADIDPGRGFRRFILKGIKIAGHSGYTDCVRIGNFNPSWPGTKEVIVLGRIENVEVKGCAAIDAAGVRLWHAVSFSIDNLYAYGNDHGLMLGTTTGDGIITTVSVQNSQFRVNVIGVGLYSGTGVKTFNNVYESNKSIGMLLQGFGGGANGGHTFIGDWYEANTDAGLYVTNSVLGSNNPVPATWISCGFSGGSQGPIVIEDGDLLRFEGSHVVGRVNIATPNLRTVWTNTYVGGFAGPGSPTATRINYGLQAVPYKGIELNGMLSMPHGHIVVTTEARGAGLALNSVDLGNGGRGPTVSIGRNSNPVGPAAGIFRLTDRHGIQHHIWADEAGQLRIRTGNSPPAVSDSDGAVLGDQSSSLDSKSGVVEFTDYELALKAILTTPLHSFTYKSGAYNGEQFIGVITDYAPLFGKDRDPGHPGGRALNEVTAIGYLFGAVKSLLKRIEALENEKKQPLNSTDTRDRGSQGSNSKKWLDR